MEYYGQNKFKRVVVGCFYDSFSDSNVISKMKSFMEKKNEFWEFVEQESKSAEKKNIEFRLDVTTGFESKKYNGNIYWFGNAVRAYNTGVFHSENNHPEAKMMYFMELPGVYSDKDFHWKENKKYNSLEAVIKKGCFEFFCVFRKGTNDAVVDVRYTKCDNKHRNKVTISTIEVHDASNEEIINAIETWKCEFADDLNRS